MEDATQNPRANFASSVIIIAERRDTAVRGVSPFIRVCRENVDGRRGARRVVRERMAAVWAAVRMRQNGMPWLPPGRTATSSE